MDAAWQPLIARAKAAWPSIEIEDETFVSYVIERLEPGEGPGEAAELRLEDLYLACACARGTE